LTKSNINQLKQDTMVSGKLTPSQSHGGALYYLVEVPREEYEKQRSQSQCTNHFLPHEPRVQTTVPRQSTDSGWDNPFRPGGDLSREADEIVNLIKGGKPITPTTENHINGNAVNSLVTENGTTVIDGVTKKDAKTLQSAQNGTKSPQKPAQNGDTQQISNQVVSGPQSATTVVLDEKKKKKCTCCVIQ